VWVRVRVCVARVCVCVVPALVRVWVGGCVCLAVITAHLQPLMLCGLWTCDLSLLPLPLLTVRQFEFVSDSSVHFSNTT
jgi:hypothetical protein